MNLWWFSHKHCQRVIAGLTMWIWSILRTAIIIEHHQTENSDFWWIHEWMFWMAVVRSKKWKAPFSSYIQGYTLGRKWYPVMEKSLQHLICLPHNLLLQPKFTHMVSISSHATAHEHSSVTIAITIRDKKCLQTERQKEVYPKRQYWPYNSVHPN